ncbi:PEP/pyruvate-binding domain-containing protein [Desulfovibrio inopinatus]|uniref:PEP/pyruvate-binding domain-containing protein n=1 Tax=Desulfovibrio inopinatus TaxID=102109 RepID=UPI00042462C9|nr:PEP/pyruvate-binding domain-containing protein [Desulfovibrio inopinatus]
MTRKGSFFGKWLSPWGSQDKRSYSELFSNFRVILKLNNRILTAISSMNNKLGGSYVFDQQYLRSSCEELVGLVRHLIDSLDALAPGKYDQLRNTYRAICAEIDEELSGRPVFPNTDMILAFSDIGTDDLEAVGGKCAHLAEIGNAMDVKIPSGIAVTTAAFQAFLVHNNLVDFIIETEEDWLKGKVSVDDASSRIQERIRAGRLPSRLRKALCKAVENLVQSTGETKVGLAVRSSAWGEDGEHSFAGQYVSLLNQRPERVRDAYREVLAGAYSSSAMSYRQDTGYQESEVAMAASVQTMIDAKVSGVVYSLSPQEPSRKAVLIAATWGLGAPVVSGEAAADRFTVSRKPPYEHLSLNIVRKEYALRLAEGGGVRSEVVPEEIQTKACLDTKEITALTRLALQVERHFRKPQDIEFAFDHQGRLFLLQARPLRVQIESSCTEELCDSLRQYPVILSGTGDVAQLGIAAGPVYHAREGGRFEDFPIGAILVARHSSPSFAPLLRRAAGVITDIGSTVGHMATIAREFRVPALLNAGDASETLVEGEVVTLDAEQKTVYRGRVEELCLHELTSDPIEDSYEYRLLRRLLKRIEPLNLIDPTDRNFTPEGCRSLHDITRFVHEKAVETLIHINHVRRFDATSTSGRLEMTVPLDLIVLDIGGGLALDPHDREHRLSGRSSRIKLEQVLSAPMNAFIEGVSAPGIWQSSPVPVDFSSFMSSLTRTFSTELSSPKDVGQNLAVISNHYVHLSLRLGYHFTMIDAYASENPADNYAYFRFTGGVTGEDRRERRARFLADILEQNDFSTTLQGDLVVARIKKLDAPGILRRMRILGLLVAYTRQLDVSMRDDGHISSHIDAFQAITAAIV